MSRVDILSISCKIALRWMPQDFTDDKSTLVQVMAWCHQATSHYLDQCWLRSILPYGVARPQWVNSTVAKWHHMATHIWVNIGSGNGLLPAGTKPLPEPMLSYHRSGPVIFIWAPFHKRYLRHQSLKLARNYLSKISFKPPRGQWIDTLGQRQDDCYFADNIF